MIFFLVSFFFSKRQKGSTYDSRELTRAQEVDWIDGIDRRCKTLSPSDTCLAAYGRFLVTPPTKGNMKYTQEQHRPS